LSPTASYLSSRYISVKLDKGHIAEDGGDEELISQSGTFADLPARQRLDDTAYAGKTTVY
jgi:hypothetical protein